MKRFLGCMLLIALAGCSKEPVKSAAPAKPKAFVDPAKYTVVETAEAKDCHEIRAQAKQLFDATNYNGLEELATKYSDMSDCYPEGFSKLGQVYRGIVPDSDAAEDDFKTALPKMRKWIVAKPDSMTARLAIADTLINYAWKARGSGWADSVSKEGWKLMGERLTESAQFLKEAGSLKEQSPRRWTLFMTAALGLNATRPQYEALFRKAVSSCPDNFAAYSDMAYYLLPRWHGQPGETKKFITDFSDQIGGENGDLFYARLTWSLRRCSTNIFEECNLSWDRVDKGFQVMEKRYPNSTYVENARAYFAVIGSTRKADGQTRITAMNGNIDTNMWTSKDNFVRMTAGL